MKETVGLPQWEDYGDDFENGVSGFQKFADKIIVTTTLLTAQTELEKQNASKQQTECP